MKNSSLQNVKRIHFIAICGMGMAPLAGLFKEKGFEVTGSDTNVYPPMSDQLNALGIKVKVGYRRQNLDEIPKPDLVIVGNAVSKTNEEVQEVLARGIPYFSMPEALEKIFLADRFPIVVAGTHGKTTTSGLLAWMLKRLGKDPGFLVGGVLKNFGRSYQLGREDYFVVEGDEYDSAFFDKGPKFLHYHPRILVLNAVEFDHADIYPDLGAVMVAFSRLISQMPPDGLILACSDSPNVRTLIKSAPCRVLTFGLEGEADLKAATVEYEEKTRFRLIRQGREIGALTSPMVGRHNINNLLGVVGVLLELGVPYEKIQPALSEFQGVMRRQEVLGTIRGITVIDDFAHHPTAVAETLAGLKMRYPERRLWAIFEPRSNTTRRKIFQKEFVASFDQADEIVLAPPYLIEKIPSEERLNTGQLVQDLQRGGKKARFIATVDEISETVSREATPGDILVIMSNGDFGGLHQKILQKLRKT